MKKSQFTEQELQVIASIQEERNSTRKAAVQYFKRHRDEYMRRGTKAAVAPVKENASTTIIRAMASDAKMAAANDKLEAPAPKLPAKNASFVAKGAAYHVLAGRPAKQAVVAVFGKSGYALSWVTRAERLGVSPQDLCEAFRLSPTKVADQWAALEAK